MGFYVFDLDGTLADCTHRLHLIADKKRDWKEFFAACGRDQPIVPAVEIFRSLWPRHRVEIWTARSDEVEVETREWLRAWRIPEIALTKMRPAGDHRNDDVLKRAMLHDSIAEGLTPTAVFEDRARVVRMWREEGIPCFQVAPGDF